MSERKTERGRARMESSWGIWTDRQISPFFAHFKICDFPWKFQKASALLCASILKEHVKCPHWTLLLSPEEQRSPKTQRNPCAMRIKLCKLFLISLPRYASQHQSVTKPDEHIEVCLRLSPERPHKDIFGFACVYVLHCEALFVYV